MITHLEELSLNAWPAIQTVVYDGWLLRFADGYTRRANSENPLYASALEKDEKIDFCEELYRKRALPTVFKLTSAALPDTLDAALQAKGYQKDAPTSVQMLELEHVSLGPTAEVELKQELSTDWLAAFCDLSGVAPVHSQTLQRILSLISPEHCFAAIKQDQRIVACGLGVLQSGYIGLFDNVTDRDFRRRGYGRQIVENLLAWGRQNQAHHGYLQVMLNNAPALQLYANIGFVEQYQYWYRVRS